MKWSTILIYIGLLFTGAIFFPACFIAVKIVKHIIRVKHCHGKTS